MNKTRIPRVFTLVTAVIISLSLGGCRLAYNAYKPAPSPALTEAPIKREKANILAGKRLNEEHTDHLKVSGDYGELIPYVGALAGESEFFSDRFIYGLMTAEGTVITDPVYSSCMRSDFLYYNEWEAAALIMYRQTGGIDVAATDGSRCTEFDALRASSNQDGICLFSDTAMTALSAQGEVLKTYYYEDMDIPEEYMKDFIEHIRGGFGFTGERHENLVYLMQLDGDNFLALDMESGKAETVGFIYYEPTAAQYWEKTVRAGNTLISHGDESYIIPYALDYSHNSVHGDYVLFEESGAVYTLDGELFLPADENSRVYWYSDLLHGREGDGEGVILRLTYGEQGTVNLSCYRANGTEFPMPEEWQTLNGESAWAVNAVGGLLQLVNTDGSAYYNLDTGKLVCAFGF